MKDLYLRPQRSTRGCLIALVVLLLVVLAVVWIWRRPRRPAPERAEDPVPVASTASVPAPQPTSDTGLTRLAQARQLRGEDKLVDARDLAWQVLDQSSNQVARTGAEALLGEINVEVLLSPRMMPEKEEYIVASGDSLDRLRKRFSTTVEVIRRGNRIPGDVIRVGDRLRIFKGNFSMEISKSRNDLVLRMNDRFFKRYRVGTGEYGKTPEGDFKIVEKIAQPTWWRPDGKPIPYGDPENVLGTHWLSLDIPGYGIHGTWAPDTIGKQASAGCIRLLNAEVEELFTLVPDGTPVRIVE